jgi:hypothetical protein
MHLKPGCCRGRFRTSSSSKLQIGMIGDRLVGGLRGHLLDRLTLSPEDKVVSEEPLAELHERIRDVRVGTEGALHVLTLPSPRSC